MTSCLVCARSNSARSRRQSRRQWQQIHKRACPSRCCVGVLLSNLPRIQGEGPGRKKARRKGKERAGPGCGLFRDRGGWKFFAAPALPQGTLGRTLARLGPSGGRSGLSQGLDRREKNGRFRRMGRWRAPIRWIVAYQRERVGAWRSRRELFGTGLVWQFDGLSHAPRLVKSLSWFRHLGANDDAAVDHLGTLECPVKCKTATLQTLYGDRDLPVDFCCVLTVGLYSYLCAPLSELPRH